MAAQAPSNTAEMAASNGRPHKKRGRGGEQTEELPSYGASHSKLKIPLANNDLPEATAADSACSAPNLETEKQGRKRAADAELDDSFDTAEQRPISKVSKTDQQYPAAEIAALRNRAETASKITGNLVSKNTALRQENIRMKEESASQKARLAGLEAANPSLSLKQAAKPYPAVKTTPAAKKAPVTRSNYKSVGTDTRILDLSLTDAHKRLATIEQSRAGMADFIDNLRADVADLEEKVEEAHDRLIVHRNKIIANQGKNIAKRVDIIVAKYGEIIAKRDENVADRDKIIADREQTIADQEKTIAKRDIIVAKQDDTIADRDKIIADREQTIADLEKTIAKRDEIIGIQDKIVANRVEMIGCEDREKGLLRELSEAKQKVIAT